MYRDEGADGDFVMVDTSKLPRRLGPRWRRANANNAGLRTDEDPTKVERMTRNLRKAANSTSHNKRYKRLQHARMESRRRWGGGPAWTRPSVALDPAWSLVEELEMSRLETFSAEVPEGSDVKLAGTLRATSESFAGRVLRREPLVRQPGVNHPFVPTRHDSAMLDLIAEDAGTVYATDAAVATLMTARHALRPWDLVFTVYGGSTIVMDSRDGAAQAFLELETVHENSYRPPEAWDAEDINHAHQMSIEAARATRALREAVVDGSSAAAALPGSGASIEAHPHEAPGLKPESVLYRYRRFPLGDDTLVVRTAVHGYEARASGPDKVFTAAALPERWARGAKSSEWRKLYATRPGDVLLAEIRDNRNKVGRFCASTLLAGADELKLGFVTRRGRDDPSGHEVVGMESVSPAKLLHQMSMSQENMWGVVRWAVDLVRAKVADLQAAKQEAGMLGDAEEDDDDYKYLFMYVPATEVGGKPGLRVYEIRQSDFADEEEEEEEEGAAASASASSRE